MPHPATAVQETTGGIAPHLRRLLEFVEPDRDDVCLDVARGRGPMPAALRPRVRHVTAVDATPAPEEPGRNGRMATVEFGTGPVRITGSPDDGDRPPAMATREDPRPRPAAPAVEADATALPYHDNTFSLVTARFSLYTLGEPERVLRELLRVCRPGGRLIIADLVRGNLAGPERDRIERLRDPDHPGTPSIARLTEMITSAGASIRRLDVFTVERPVEPWLAGARDEASADRIREALTDEVDGGPRTGAKPRVIGGELWFTQSWAHVAAEPI
ncbi:2-methoxy-6-polyprenyl-1,4-benzoquinol methylase [Actinomadura sp. RB99]|uniref:methyltransferase domain-containing protein n=1 Tax=Actinomadura sp. RB99 TaxID=2691577 RepID=UPI001682A2BC|nr:2-methoxy-6-polyprenyl-1,4-benzoquinol methylase [Actinomadura sp. RB99]